MSKQKKENPKGKVLTAVIFAVILLLSGLGVAHEIMLSCAQRGFEVLLEENVGRYNEGRIVLSSTSSREAQSVADALGGSLRITKNGCFALVTLPDGVTLADIAENRELRQYMTDFSLDYNDFVVGTEDTDVAADGDIRANFQTDEPMYPQQTYLDYINIGDCWNVSMGENADGEKVTVAVIDSGIDTDHPEFTDADGNSIISAMSYDATDDRIVNNDGISVIEDEHGHGTAVAGVIASQINGSGIMGIAPDVEILVIKCDADETGEFKSSADIIFGIYYAIEQDVDVINMSFGTTESSRDLLNALQLAVDSDIIPVAAAGNESTANQHYPAALDTTIGVGALAQDSWELADYSNYGDNSDIVAPGTTLTTLIGGGYGTENGTSMAAPVVSAAVAIYRSQHPYATFEQVKNDLLAAGKDLGELGEDMYFGFGALDMNAFICEEKGSITYDYCTEDLEATTQVFVKQHTIQTVPEPERENIVFDDWYYDEGYTRVFDYDAWYTTEFVEDVTLYAKWVNEDDEGASVYSYKTLDDGTVEITSYKGKRRYLTIPDEIDDMTVSAIGISAFADNTRLREVVLPKGLTTIREYAFDGVSRLRAVTFTGDMLQCIEQRAFQNCSSLRQLELPDSVVTIGMEAFVNCSSLSAIEITQDSTLESLEKKAFSKTALSYLYLPAGVTEFDGSVLAYCRNMRSVDIHVDNAAFVVQDNIVLSVDGMELVYYPAVLNGTLTVPEGVVKVGDYACTASSMTQATLPESLEQIGKLSFAESKLAAVQIPAKVIQIDPGAFKKCSRLTDLTFAEEAQLSIIDGDKLIGGAFEDCTQLSELELPDSLIKLGEQSFKGCYGISELYLPGRISEIGNSAFEICRGLRTVTFAENSVLSTIPQYCFAYCNTLNTVNFSDGIKTIERYAFTNDYLLHSLNFGTDSVLSSVGDYSFYSCTVLNQMQLPENVTSIGKYAYAFSGLTSVHVPANLTSIGDGAFGACYLLTGITADAEHTVYAAVDNVLFSKNITTVYCVPSSRIGSYTLPETVQITAPYSFYYDKLLTEVSLPEGLLEIQHDSFYSCSGLQSIAIPGTVTNIGRMGFYNCRSLSNVTFGEYSQLQRLGLYTFVSCGMSEITIPASVESMAQYVFSNCSDLKKITFASDSKLPYVSAYLLSGTQVEEVIFADGSALSQIQAHAFDGADYLKSVDFGDAALETIDNYAFYNCAALESIAIPETVSYLGRHAFYGCVGLDRMDIPAAMDYIGISAFNGTSGMKVFFESDSLPANAQEGWDEGIAGYFLAAKEYVVTDEWEYIVTHSGSTALARYNGSSTELTIDTVDGYQVEKIGAGCFADNETLTAVTLSADVREIDNYAFRNSNAVVTIPADSVLERIGNYAFGGNATESLILPDSVTYIGAGAFEGGSMKTLSISESSSLKTIGDRAFCGSSIESIYLPASLETVGVEAFKNAASLTEVTIEDGDTTLKLSNSAFEGSGITEITVPSRVNYIGEYAFGSCPNLENIHADDANTAYQDLNGVLLDSSGATLIQYPSGRDGAYEIPAQITVLNYASFKNTKGLTELTFAEGSTVKTIGWQTFSGCDGLTKITVPDSVISFDFYAFENCTSLTDVVLGEESQLTGVYEGAFYGCTALTSLSLPDTVIDIGDYAFCGCTSLPTFPVTKDAQTKGIGAHAFEGCTGITQIPVLANLTDVGEFSFAYTSISEFTASAVLKDIANSAFYGCEDMMNIYCEEANEDFTAIDGVLYEKGVTGSGDYDALVVWPYARIMILGEGNTELTAMDTAFLMDTTDIRFVIADTVTTIAKGAFREHKLLKHITIPETVVTIDEYAFYDCYSLETVDFVSENSVTIIGPSAFQNCISLEEITIIDSVTTIGSNAFLNCTELEKIYYNAVAASDLSSSSNGVFHRAGMSSDGITLIVGAKTTRLPAYLFCASTIAEVNLQNVVFEDGSVCESIGRLCFFDCRNLRKITIPECVMEIGRLAFDGCTGLISAGPAGEGYYYEYEWKTSIPDYAFEHCHGLTNVVFPDGLVSIGAYAFNGCAALSHISIPESVTSIGNGTFIGCKSLSSAGPVGGGYHYEFAWTDEIPNYAFAYNGLTSVTIPDTVTKVGYNSFYGCKSLSTAGPIGGGYSYEFGWTDSIPDYAFSYCSGLTRIVLPESTTRIGAYAFRYCSGLTDIAIPETVASIGRYAFKSCTSLTKIVIPKSVTEMGGDVFAECTWLTDAGPIGGGYSIEYGWTEVIPDHAFYGCTELTSISFPESITSIGEYTFYNCAKLTNMTLPEKITIIGSNTFYGCTGLTSVRIPESVKAIRSRAFDDCTGLVSVTVPESVTSIDSYAFSNCSSLVSAGPIGGGYHYEFGWTESIPKNAFYECTGLESVTLPDNLIEIGENAFNRCAKLTKISVPESVDTVGWNAFYGTGFTDAGPYGGGYDYEFGWTEAIPAYAFNYCTRLNSITIPECVTKVGWQAFSNSTNLKMVRIESSTIAQMIESKSACENLCAYADTIVIPAHITSIGSYITDNFTYVENMICDGAECTVYSKNAHVWDEGVVICECEKCQTDGVTIYTCTECSLVKQEIELCHDLKHYDGQLPTCKDFGWEAYDVCTDCGYSSFTVLPATGHSYESDVTDPTCTEQGFTTHTCSVCGDRYVDTYVDALGHDMGEWETVTEAACTEDGSERRDCSRCDHYEARTIQATGHSFGAWFVNRTATCTEAGENRRNCTNCSYYETEVIPATGHSYESVVTAPTCTEKGYTTHTCTTCGDSYVDTYVDALGHDMGEWVTVTEATCTEDGQELRECARCDHYETRTIEATGHSYESVVTAPTCTEQGYTTHTCCVCDDTYVDTYVDALGHDLGEWIVVIEATCTEDGQELRECARCDHYETRIIEAHGHSYGSIVTAPTCTEQGYTRYVCSICGDSYVSDYVAPTGHDHEAVVTAPTCTERGYTTYTCHCGDRYVSDYTDPQGHDMGAWEISNDATCTEDGQELRECARCDYSQIRAIEALGHEWGEGVVTVEPTEEAEGEMTYTCFRCGETRTEAIPELEHEHRYEAVVTAPTCTEQGYTTHTCRCGDSYVDSYVDALGHDMGEWFIVTEATCTSDGMEQCDCSRCDHYETRVIEATGHDYESVVTEPTCTEQGFTIHTCVNCGDSYTDSYIDALGHSFTEYVSDGNATCTQDGTKTAVCDRCVATDTVIDEGSAHGHDFTDWTVILKPTETAEGLESRQCLRCGVEETRTVACLENPFTDIPSDSFYYEPVMWAVENGITNGTSATTFGPNDQCMRAHVVTFLWRAVGSPEPTRTDNPFVDVKESDFYYKAVMWALENGITSGMDATHFGPTAYCNRAQVVTFLYRTMGSPEVESTENPFTDVTPGAFYEKAVLWAVENGITNGLSVTSFGPNAICNRAQIVTFLYRAFVNE